MPWLIPLLIGAAALFLLRTNGGDPLTMGGSLTAPPAGPLPNYPPSTPDSVSTGIASAIAGAYKPPMGAMAAAAPPPVDTGPVLPGAPPVIQPMPVPSFMGGASWQPSGLTETMSVAAATSIIGQALTAPPPTTGPTTETRSGRGHF